MPVRQRAPDKTRHSLADLVGQRIFGIACGHPDCNDGDRLADDPVHELLLDRDPDSGERLASQPTLSRFENAVTAARSTAWRTSWPRGSSRGIGRRVDGRARCITTDLDPTDDPTHGAQQYTLFNAYYDNWYYLPRLAFLRFDRESEQYLCAALLRRGKAVASDGPVGLLSRLLPDVFVAVNTFRPVDGGGGQAETGRTGAHLASVLRVQLDGRR
ncbi:MAG: transposase [Acidobacteria bacterium]|nr:transposase [Acidobacteriota bacterium]